MQLLSFKILGQTIQEWIKYLLGFSVLALSLLFAWVYLSRDIYFDDAFMFIRYAENLAQHGVFGWNADEAAYGCTSTGYVFSTFLLIKAGLLQLLSQAKLLQVQSVVYFFLALLFIHKSNRLILSKKQQYGLEISLFVLLLLFLNPLMRRNITGMDTTMALWSNALLIFAVFKFYRNNNRGNLFFLILAAYFSFFVRPDNGLYAVIFPVLFLLLWNNDMKSLFYFSFGLGFALLLDSLIKYVYFGAVLPIPFYVKSQGFYEAYLGIDLWNTWHYLADFILYSSPFLLASGIFFKKESLLKILPFLLPLLLTNIYFLGTVPVMGFESRLLLPSIPFVVAIALVLLEEYDLKKSLDSPLIFRQALLAGVLISISYWGMYKGGTIVFAQKKAKALQAAQKYDRAMSLRPEHTSITWEAVEKMTDLIREIGDPSFVFAGSEHGFIASNNPQTKILCLVGLHNPLSLEGRALTSEEMELSLRKYQPDLIWMPHWDYPALTDYILKSHYFQQHYDFYEGVLDFGVAIRKGSPYTEQILEELGE